MYLDDFSTICLIFYAEIPFSMVKVIFDGKMTSALEYFTHTCLSIANKKIFKQVKDSIHIIILVFGLSNYIDKDFINNRRHRVVCGSLLVSLAIACTINPFNPAIKTPTDMSMCAPGTGSQ